ncbi:hypothetical protein DFH29DRAFT_920212 [Suillus ampliporus]|nr:hypothetical protein DFH29DRAFT_920212 [Suillus ampliporus]
MDVRKVILTTASVVLSSCGILLSLLAICIRTLVPSYVKALVSKMTRSKPPPQAARNSPRQIAHNFQRSPSSASSSPRLANSNNIMKNSVVDEVVPQSHVCVDEPTSPVPVTESRSNLIEVLEVHKFSKRHSLSISPPFNVRWTKASRAPKETRLKVRSSTGSLPKFSTKSAKHSSDPPLRTQPYAAPYFFPAPGSPEAIDYVTKMREELLRSPRTSGFIHRSAFTRKN